MIENNKNLCDRNKHWEENKEEVIQELDKRLNNMTLEQCIQSILDKQSHINQLETEIAKRKQQLKELTLFSVGDKVLIDKKHIVYVADVEWYSIKPYYRYRFNKEKKDGTMSGQSAGINGYTSIELIKSAGE